MLDDLYNMDILTLSAALKNDRLENAQASARVLSKLCGSWVEVDVIMEGDQIAQYASRVQACALGQSCAAILQEAVIGASLAELIEARDGLKAMLKADGPPVEGRFAKLNLLAGVREYPARHASTLLAFEAVVEAARKAVNYG